MHLVSLRPILWTSEFEATLDFYINILGFNLNERSDELTWASISKDKVEIMVSKPIMHSNFTKPEFTGSFYINVEDVEAAWNELKDQTNICYPIESFEWGMREFAIFDNNGYILQFGQEVS